MAKTGRPRKIDGTAKDIQFSIRIPGTLRDQLDAEALNHKKSRNEEIEVRLQQSLTIDSEIKKRLGGNGTALIMQLIVEGILLIESASRRGSPDASHWFDDRFMFEHVQSMIETVLDQFKPTGRKAVPKSVHPLMAKNLGQHVGVHILSGLEFAREYEGGKASMSPAIRAAVLPLSRRLRPGISKKMERLQKPIAKAAKAWQREQEKRK